MIETFGEVLLRLKEFDRLEELKLNFSKHCASNSDWSNEVAETEDFWDIVLDTLFQGLSQRDGPLVFTISGLQDA